MRHPARISLLFTALLIAGGSAFAQSATDFYLGLLRRGASSVEAGQYDAAATPLRIAAFGLVETIDHYQTALAYLAIAQDRTGNTDGARDSVRRLVAAERIEKKFGSLQLPQSVRSAFTDVAKKHLSPADANALATGGAISAPPRQLPVTTTRPAPSTVANNTTTTTPQQQPATAQPQPATAQPERKPATTTTTTTTAPPPATTNTTPAQSKPEPKPAVVKPESKPAVVKTTEPKPADPKPAPPQTTTTTAPATVPAKPATTQPATTQPAPVQSAPKPALSAKDIASRIASAERALTNAQLTDARRLYRELLDAPGLDRETLLRVVEGLYRARDFAGALAAFKSLGTLKRGEEPYGYYQAVSLYETGQYDAARKVLAAAIPFIEMTPDVVRYRAKIEGAR